MAGRTFVIGDIHGAYRALRQCLAKSRFDHSNDHLVCLGDVADGWPETKECVDELLKVKNLTYILGNHDWWTLEWMQTGEADNVWYTQGGKATVDSYAGGIPATHIQLLSNAHHYYILNKKLFVHAGIDTGRHLERQDLQTFLWDRTLASLALSSYSRSGIRQLTLYDEVYLGHTPIPFPHPIHAGGVWLMDTGAGWSGVLSMMDIETKETFISEPVPELYPGVQGRQRFG